MYAPLRLPSVILIMSPREFFSVRAYRLLFNRKNKQTHQKEKGKKNVCGNCRYDYALILFHAQYRNDGITALIPKPALINGLLFLLRTDVS